LELQTYSDVLKYLEKERRTPHLLIGNGFGLDYDKDLFSYNALSDFIAKTGDSFLSRLFDIIKTKNFEQVMQQLDNFLLLAKEFGTDKDLIVQIENAAKKLKESLVDAIEVSHPKHIFKIPEENSLCCANFLKYFTERGNIFSTNYDLLLYWVLMRHQDLLKKAIDGFGRPSFDEEDKSVVPDLVWGSNSSEQNIHYLHGTLPIFDTGTTIEKETYSSYGYLIENIKKRIDKKEYPLFVTAGNGEEKLNHILHNQYLSFCMEKFKSIEGSLITVGFSFSEYDEHIIDAINEAAKHGKNQPPKLWSVYIGVFSEKSKAHIESIKRKFKCKVNIFDSKTINIWRKPA
jgi:hypothetical protein